MPHELVVFQELANVGSAHAATALSQVFGTRVDMTPPLVRQLDTRSAIEFLEPTGDEVSAAILHLQGELSGLVVLLTRDIPGMLALTGMEPGIETDVISELGNIAAAKLAEAIGTMASIDGHPTPPAAGTTLHTSVVEMILALTAQTEPFVVALSELSVAGTVLATLMFYPDAAALERIQALA